MKVENNVVIADEGFAIRRVGDNSPSDILRVALSPNDKPENWEDCEFGVEHNDTHETVKYSTLLIKRELERLGKWKEIKDLLVKYDYWDDFVLANYLAQDDSVFCTACAAIVQYGILEKNQLTMLLPKCIWTAD